MLDWMQLIAPQGFFCTSGHFLLRLPHRQERKNCYPTCSVSAVVWYSLSNTRPRVLTYVMRRNPSGGPPGRLGGPLPDRPRLIAVTTCSVPPAALKVGPRTSTRLNNRIPAVLGGLILIAHTDIRPTITESFSHLRLQPIKLVRREFSRITFILDIRRSALTGRHVLLPGDMPPHVSLRPENRISFRL